jgi:hypothetical protein
MVRTVSVTFEVAAEGETLEDLFRDAIDAARSGRGCAVHVEALSDDIREASPEAAVTATTNPGA